MKKLITILMMLCAFGVKAQEVGDATIQTYADTYINTNGTGSITGAQMNQVLSYLIDSKVNHDSATTVRIATTKDTLFITYWGYAEDTIPISGDSSLWGKNGAYLYTLPQTTRIGIGTGSSPATQLHIVDSVGSLGINPYMYSSTAGQYPQLNFGKFNGSPSSFSAIATNTSIGGINFFASYNASTSTTGAAIKVRSTQAWTASNRGTEMLFYTCEKDSSVADISVRIDTNANVRIPYGDVITFGGWDDWTPTIAWTGGTPGAATINRARYNVTNRKVSFEIDIEGDNDSGSILTAVSFTPPIAIPDVDAFYAANCIYSPSSKVTPSDRGTGLVDAETNLKIYAVTLSIANSNSYRVVVTGFYEINNK